MSRTYDAYGRSKKKLAAKTNELFDKNYFPEATPIYFSTSMSARCLRLLNLQDFYYSSFCGAYNLINLERISYEFNKIAYGFYETLLKGSIHEIHRIENPYMLVQYYLRRDQKEQNDGYVTEHTFYHATSSQNVHSICTNNFDWRLHGLAKGHKHGQGISFSPHMKFANKFSTPTEIKVMFVVKVLETRSHVGEDYHVLPKDGYDTTTSKNGNVFVKFEDAEFLPIYVIYYEVYDAQYYDNNTYDYQFHYNNYGFYRFSDKNARSF